MKAVTAVRRKKSLWALHLAGNAALAAAIYQWLWIPDRTVTDLALTAFAGLAIVALALWLHGGTLIYFRREHQSGAATLGGAFRLAARRLPALAVWALVVAFVGWAIMQLMNWQTPVSNWIASWLTLRLRRPVRPDTVAWIYGWIVWFAAWVKWPFMLLPWAESALQNGFAAYRWSNLTRPLRTSMRPRYWLQFLTVFVIGAVIPALLVNWQPAVEGIRAETASLVIRFLVAYVIAIAAWLVMASVLGAWGEREWE
ncbi:MAG TPA: hypothetical protein VFY29_15165 [Terriglobia bacterium]|nr:hypothetical protein [Terriglobia bacterium]